MADDGTYYDENTYKRLYKASQELKITFTVAVVCGTAAGAGATVGTLIAPGVGTIVGAVVGAIIAVAGTQHYKAKSISQILLQLRPTERRELLIQLTRQFGNLAAKSIDDLRNILRHPLTKIILENILNNL